MTKAYFIGGAPRVGKTTAMQSLITKHPVFGASTDAIRSTLRGVIDYSDNPVLFGGGVNKFDSTQNVVNMRDNPSLVVEQQNNESEVVWKSVIDFAKSNIDDGQGIAIEGVAILPHNLTTGLPFDYRAVFLVNLSDQTDLILHHARTNPHDWLHKYTDETIRAFCVFNRQLNLYYYDQAIFHKLPIVVIDNDFDLSIQQAVDSLLA